MGENYFKRRWELQRAANIAQNEVRWEAAEPAAKKALAERTEKKTEVAEQSSNIPPCHSSARSQTGRSSRSRSLIGRWGTIRTPSCQRTS